MRRFLPIIFGLAVLVAGAAAAQRTGITITTVGNLPASCTAGQPFVVIDGNSASDCATGSGSTAVFCTCDSGGASYTATGDGSAAVGADSIGTSELDDSADTPLAGEWVQVSGDTTDFVYRTDAELLSDTGAAALASPAFSGDPTAPTPSVDDNDTSVATTAFVQAETFGGDVSGTMSTTQVDDVQSATTNTETQGNSTTQVASTAFVDGEIRGAWAWNMFEVFPDNTQCQPAIGATINSGPVVSAIECADNAASAFYGDTLDEEYSGGTLVFTLQAVNENAAPSGALDFDFSCQCRGDSDAVNATWGTAANASITFNTQYDLEHGDTAAVTCDGTCAAGDTVFWRAVMDDTATTTQVADTKIIGVTAREQ